MIEFEFEKAETKRLGEILIPTIPVTIVGPKRRLNVYMLLDSGAHLSLIPYSVEETIGLELDIEKRSEVQGLGEGSVPYILSPLRIRIGDIEVSARVGWALIEEVPFILDRLDVFQKFSVEFREFENKIILKRASASRTKSRRRSQTRRRQLLLRSGVGIHRRGQRAGAAQRAAEIGICEADAAEL
jgi:hypothetical protein